MNESPTERSMIFNKNKIFFGQKFAFLLFLLFGESENITRFVYILILSDVLSSANWVDLRYSVWWLCLWCRYYPQWTLARDQCHRSTMTLHSCDGCSTGASLPELPSKPTLGSDFLYDKQMMRLEHSRILLNLFNISKNSLTSKTFLYFACGQLARIVFFRWHLQLQQSPPCYV